MILRTMNICSGKRWVLLKNGFLLWIYPFYIQNVVSAFDLQISIGEISMCCHGNIYRLTVGEVVTGPYVQENEEEMNKYKGNSNTLSINKIVFLCCVYIFY